MNRDEKFLAVCMPAYNAEKVVTKSIESILSQSFGHFTFIITDDFSTDGTLNAIRKISDPRILVSENQINQGAVATRNDMTRYCIDEGFKYMAVMDADDIAYPDRLRKQIAILENDSSLTVCGSSMKVESNSSVWRAPKYSHEIKAECIFANPLPVSTAIMRLRDIKKYGLYWDVSYAPCADYHLWYVMLFQHNLLARNTGDIDMVYSFSSDGISFGRGIGQQEEKDAAIKKLILGELGIFPALAEVNSFMRVALSRSRSVLDASGFFDIAMALKNQNYAIVDKRALESALNHRVNIYMGTVSNIDSEFKKKMIMNLASGQSYSKLESVLRRFKYSYLNRWFPKLSYSLSLLYLRLKGGRN